MSLHAEGSFGFDGQIRDLDATQVTNLDFDMPTHTLTLHLIQPDNTPAVGATIDLRITSPQNGGYPPFPMDGMNAYYWGPGGANGQTDSNGTAVIRLPLDATEGILYISHPNFPNLGRAYTTTGNTEATVYIADWFQGVPMTSWTATTYRQSWRRSPLDRRERKRHRGTGDGNGDGTPDAQQENVTSLPVLGKTDLGATDFVTVAAPAETTLTNVYTVDPDDRDAVAVAPPQNVTLPEGLTAFKLTGIPVGSEQTISIFTASTAGVTGYAKYNPGTQKWTTLDGDRVTIYPNRVDIRIQDGGPGDADGVANGTIDDPGGFAEIVDNEAPTVRITGVIDGSTYRLDEAPTPGCDASDNLGLAGPCTLELAEGDLSSGLGTFTYRATAVDGAGNAAEPATVTYRVVLDDQAPVVTGTATTEPNANGWYRDDVTIAWSAADPAPTSGGVTNPAVDAGDRRRIQPLGDVPRRSATSPATARPGSSTESTSTGRPRPFRSWGSPRATLPRSRCSLPSTSARAELTCRAIDDLSGLDDTCSGTLTGGSPNGVGTFVYTATARDRAGNEASASYTFRVEYRMDGFLQPINDQRITPGVAPSVFKAGSTVPVKFQLKRADGSLVTPADAPRWMTPRRGAAVTSAPNEPALSDPASAGTAFTFADDHWQFNWKTTKADAGYWYTIGAMLDDGSVRTVVVGAR